MQGWCTDDARVMHGWCTDDAWMMYGWCTDDARMIHGWCIDDARMMHEWMMLISMILDHEACISDAGFFSVGRTNKAILGVGFRDRDQFRNPAGGRFYCPLHLHSSEQVGFCEVFLTLCRLQTSFESSEYICSVVCRECSGQIVWNLGDKFRNEPNLPKCFC